jgi:hypothetical protein
LGNVGIIATGLLFTAGNCVPIFRSGGRTNLTLFEWGVNHTIFGPPVEYVPEEDYIRELGGTEEMAPLEFTGMNVDELGMALNQMEDSISRGEKAALQIVSQEAPTIQELNEAYNNLIASGFHITRPVTCIMDGLPVTEMVLTKGSPQWALLIPLIPTVMIVGLIAFGIIKIETITNALVPILLIGGGVAIAIMAMVTRPAPMRVAEKAVERYGKRY